MVLSYYFRKPVYSLVWNVLHAIGRTDVCILYCEDAFDVQLFANVQRFLQPVPIVAKNRAVQGALSRQGFKSRILPAFPDCVIMFRNMAWKFPCGKIIRIGFEHGAYNFKRFSKAQYYNLFTVFFMTSSHDVRRAEQLGVRTAIAVGYPKIDGMFDGSVTDKHLAALAESAKLDPRKKTLLFSATWDGSGMSAVHRWYNRITELTDRFNVLVTLHPWVSEEFRSALKTSPGLFFVDDYNVLPFIRLADICIGDTNSLIAEFCLLKKPTITFRLPPTPRTMPDVIEVIERISVRISSFDELLAAIDEVSAHPEVCRKQQEAAIELFFDTPDGKAGRRAAEKIIQLVPQLAQ
ncbi:MAG: CDP-glycerol glycerophosphotransferase family protein [Chitinispirillaceae bacterium]|nr:CDP-glycerol glycerophosphotransferase family protein [Chitinispirillaceae bacterium]